MNRRGGIRNRDGAPRGRPAVGRSRQAALFYMRWPVKVLTSAGRSPRLPA